MAWHRTIEFKDAEGNPIVIQRNHIYRVTLSKGNGTTPGGNDPENADKINYEIEVLDWTEADLNFNDDETRHLEQTDNRYQFSIDKREYPELGGIGHVSAKKYAYANGSGTFLWQVSRSRRQCRAAFLFQGGAVWMHSALSDFVCKVVGQVQDAGRPISFDLRGRAALRFLIGVASFDAIFRYSLASTL